MTIEVVTSEMLCRLTDALMNRPLRGVENITSSRDLWIRDLTFEGIEPNPGPKSGKKKETIIVKEKMKVPKKMTHPNGRPKIKGHGDYVTDLVGSVLGGATSFLKPIGKLFGIGDYKESIRSNSLLGRGGNIPTFKGEQIQRISRKEYLCDVRGSSEFAYRTFRINPSENTFSWLSELAPAFTQYRVTGAIFYYVPSSGVAVSGTNSTLGNVFMTTQYDVNAPPFTTSSAISNYMFSTITVPNEPAEHWLECDPNKNVAGNDGNLFIRRGELSSNEDTRFYDMGFLQIATEGQQDTNLLGKVYISYQVELMKPAESTYGTSDRSMFYSCWRTATATNHYLEDYTNDYTGLHRWNQLGLIVDPLSRTLTFPRAGRYRFDYNSEVAGVGLTSSSVLGAPIASWSGGTPTAVEIFISVGASTSAVVSSQSVNGGATVASMTGSTVMDIPDDAVATLSAVNLAALGATGLSSQLTISLIPTINDTLESKIKEYEHKEVIRERIQLNELTKYLSTKDASFRSSLDHQLQFIDQIEKPSSIPRSLCPVAKPTEQANAYEKLYRDFSARLRALKPEDKGPMVTFLDMWSEALVQEVEGKREDSSSSSGSSSLATNKGWFS